nr:MAG TPA: tail protein [Caudoviricetes sp.]
MTPILYESDEKEFWSKGLGPLSDAEKCTVTEERNGAYTLSMTYPIDGAQADKIANNRIIKADNAYDLKNQLFVIKTVTPIMTETGEISLSVYAEHISYITNDLSIPPELSLTGTAQQALDQWKDSLIGGDASGITVDSDVTNTSSTLLSIQNVANARQALGGVEGSILYCWKGEYRFDNLRISLKKQRGTTANTLLSYGRNLLTFEQEQNIAETYTTLYPYALVTAAGGMIQKLVTIDGYLVDSKYVSHYPNRKIKTHDFTSDFQNYRIGAKPSENAEEGVTYADLATIKKYLKGKALHFMTTNDIGVPKISTTITFADLSKTDDELAKFEKLSLCDKVPVRFEKLGINSTIKVTRTVWNVLTDSYDSIELGDLNMTIGETVASVSAETSAIKTKVNQASMTAQIAADGTHNIFRTDDETEPIAKKVGDLWYKTDGKYTSMYQWDGKAWALIVNTRDTADVRAELDQAKSDMAQAKTDAQTAYDEAIKATNTANGAKAQTDEALKQAKQANDSYTALAKEVADNKSSVDADVADIRKAIDANKASADADWKQAQKDYASVSDKLTETSKTVTDIKTSVNGIKTTVANNTGKISTISQTVDGVKTSVADAQGDITSIKADVSGTKQTVANAQKDITSIKTSVSGVQTDITNAKKDITSVKTDISGVKTSVSNVQGDVTSLKTSVSGVQADVKNAKGDITSIKTDVSGVKTTIADHTGKITSISKTVDGLTTSVSNKVDKTTYQSYVTQTDKALSAKLTASDLKGYAKTADVKQTTDGLSASITKVQGNLAYQASELIGKKSFEDGSVGDWYCPDLKTKATLGKGGAPSGLSNWIYPSVAYDLYYNNAETPVKSGDVFYVEALTPNFTDTNVNVAVHLRYIQNGKVKWQTGPVVAIAPRHWGWIKGTVTVPDSVTRVIPCFSAKSNSGTPVKMYLSYASFVKLDDYTQSQLTTLSGKITATSDRLSSVYTKSETDAKLKTKVEQSALTQTSNSLSASIAKNSKILSSIGLTSDTAYINANKIALNGKTLMTNATINDAFIGSLSANKITTGTLNAAKVNLINVNASNISTGTLSGIKITSTGKDPSGTSSTTNIQSGYIDTNVINCSDYILVGKADADPRKRWQTKQDKWGMWFQTPAKLNGHTGNAPSDWQSEWQGFIRGDGWNYQTATVTGNGASGIAVAITPQQIWGRPYGGDYFQIGVWEPSYGADSVNGKKFENGWCSPRFVIDVTGQLTGHPHSITLGDTEDYTGTYNHGNLNILDGNLHVKPVYANHGIRTAWVSWSDWGSNQKIPCIVQDKDNWGGIAFPSNGRVVLFTHSYRINTDGLPRDKASVYNGWGS